ncbi:MAG: Hpt domain-containing protein [bacterium]|nr:Hpt domain-containing protein [bacterium]
MGYITKPIDFSTFFDRIGAFLKEKAATLPATTPGINQPERETLQRYKIKESVTERIKNVFIQDLESNIEEISGAIEGGLGEGRTTIKHIAHGYKGNADYFGLSLLTTAAFELDRAIKKEEPDQTISTLSKNLLVILKEIHKHNT